jgi:dienelactone hydrolase
LIVRLWLLGLALLGLEACVTHIPLSADYRGPKQLPEAVRTAELGTPGPGLVLVDDDEPLRARARFTVRQLSVPLAAANSDEIRFEYYDVGGTQRTPVIVLLPIFNGQPLVSRFFARFFANQGWAAVVVDRKNDPLEAFEKPEETIRGNLGEYRRVLDWIEQQPEIDSSRIGVFGVSLGAMDAVMLTALDERVDALVIAMAGGDLAYVMTNTRYRPVARTIDELAADEGVSREALREELARRIVTDPLTLAPYVDAQRVLMILTRTDAIVPFEAQQALRESLGAPEAVYLPTGHRPSVLYFPKVRNTAYKFFARQFEAMPVAVARH